MHVINKPGWIEVVCGSMFSGKSEELIRRVKRAKIARQQVQVFKPAIDDRYHGTKVVSHSGDKEDACAVRSVQEIVANLDPGTNVIPTPVPKTQWASVMIRSSVGLATTLAVQKWKEDPAR